MSNTTTWILVADGCRGRLLTNEGPGHGLEPVLDEALQGRNLPGREIMSDRPGRTFDSVGQGRHAKEPRTDPREVEKSRFAHDLATMLDHELKQGRFDRLVLVLPPKELGRLRAELSPAVRGCVSAELNKDLTPLASHEMHEHLRPLLAV